MVAKVIIPTYNAAKYLPSLLDGLKNQTVQCEILIIDSSSLDKTVEIAKEYTSDILIINQSDFDHGGTRTKAAKETEADILIFLTQDSLPFNQYSIENIIKVFKNDLVGAAYGKQVAYETTNIFGKHLRDFNYTDCSYFRNKKDIQIYQLKTGFLSDSFAAYRRKALESVGWFKDGLILGEDTYIGAKMILEGYTLAYVSEAKVYHSHSYTIGQEFKRYFDIGVFHKRESWILNEFGKAEGEGLRYIKSEFKYLCKHKKYYLIPEFFIRNFMKYLGYKLGYYYKLLPNKIIQKLSMHNQWWNKFL